MKPLWCKIQNAEYVLKTLVKQDARMSVCFTCEKNRECSMFEKYLHFNNKQLFRIIDINKNPLPSRPMFCNHCRKDSAKIVALGTESGDCNSEFRFLVQCSCCHQRWTMKIKSYNKKFKTNWRI